LAGAALAAKHRLDKRRPRSRSSSRGRYSDSSSDYDSSDSEASRRHSRHKKEALAAGAAAAALAAKVVHDNKKAKERAVPESDGSSPSKNVRIQSAPTTPAMDNAPNNRPGLLGLQQPAPFPQVPMAPQYSGASGTTEEIPRNEIPMPQPPGGYGPSAPMNRYPPSTGYVPPPQPQYVPAPKSILKNGSTSN